MKLILCILGIACCFSLSAKETITDFFLWKAAYERDYSLASKLVLNRKINTTTDQIMNHFMMCYIHYRAGINQKVEDIFLPIDAYIEYNYIRDKNDKSY